MSRKQKLLVVLAILMGTCQLAANHHPSWGRAIQLDVIDMGYVIEVALFVWAVSGRQRPRIDG